MPDPAVERDCAKARSPSLLRWASLNPRRKQCFSYVQTASAATKTSRQNLRKHESVLSSVRSAFRVLNPFLVENAQTVVVSLFLALVAWRTS